MKWVNLTSWGNQKKKEFDGHDVIFSLSFFSIPFSALMFYVNFLVTVNPASVRLKADKSDWFIRNNPVYLSSAAAAKENNNPVFHYLSPWQAPSPLSGFREAATGFFIFIIYSSIHRFAHFISNRYVIH